MGIIPDWGHLVLEGWEDPLSTVQILGMYLDSVMLKNYGLYPERRREDGTTIWGHCPETLRKGCVDIANVFAALNAVGFDGWITLAETMGDVSTRDRLADALSYAKAANETTRNAKPDEWVYDYSPFGGTWSGLSAGAEIAETDVGEGT